MQLTLMSMNLQYAGRSDADGRPDDRWPQEAEIVRKVRPDILLAQEAHGWMADPRLQAAAERDLDMRAHVAPSRSGAHTVLMHRTDTIRWRHWETKYADQTLHGFGVAVLDLLADPKVKTPLTVITAHLTPYSAHAAAQEAQVMLGRVYRYGGMGLIGGDINHCPPGDTEPDWDSVPPYNRSSRCHRRHLPPQEPFRANHIVGQTLADGDLHDVAAHLATDNPSSTELRAPTGHGGIRVDQVWVTANMVNTVLGYRQIDTGRASDHNAIVVTFSTDALHDVQERTWI
ncbi:hypothetical protein [Spirillospora sp. CA-128828]|uniref:hypothetical protein n=1 Tax=Spirillospora sp. CA-128828 TaxID=3240033 RepID=UPI003D8D6CE9